MRTFMVGDLVCEATTFSERYIAASALFTVGRGNRTLLSRTWRTECGDPAPSALFIMRNPSTAGVNDDPTIRRCVDFANANGCGRMEVVNLDSRVATNPKDLTDFGCLSRRDEEQRCVFDAVRRTHKFIVCAWGAGPDPCEAARGMVRFLRTVGNPVLWCLGHTKDGHPQHPLYLKAGLPFVRWVRPYDRMIGDYGVRDPENYCASYAPREFHGETAESRGYVPECETDGHYLCKGCLWRRPDEKAE
jgi:hypothetical protein